LTATNDPEEISWGKSCDHCQGQLLHITLHQPSDPRSREKGYWAASLVQLTHDGWDLAYSDGSGRNSNVCSGAYVQDAKLGDFLGDLASVADGERKGSTLAFTHAPTDRKICVMSDSTTAIHTALPLSRGAPPQVRHRDQSSGKPPSPQKRHRSCLNQGPHRLRREHHCRQLSGATLTPRVNLSPPRIATYEGLRAASRANRKGLRTQLGFGVRRPDWHRHALSAYTWYRTERGPQKAWLHQIRKTDDPSCPCGHPSQTGEHIVFQCPRHASLRKRLLRAKKSWPELDNPDWRKEGDDDSYDAIESFFDYLYFES